MALDQLGCKAFDFNNNIRVINMDGEPWFPAKDVCDLLGLGNTSDAVENACCDVDSQTVKKSNLDCIDISYPNRGMLCVNESGLYALVLTSQIVCDLCQQDGHMSVTKSNLSTGEINYTNRGMLCVIESCL